MPLVKPVMVVLGVVGRELAAIVRLPSSLIGVSDHLAAIREDVERLNAEVTRMRMGVDELGEYTEPMPEQMAQIAEGFALLGPELHAINQAVRPLRRARARLSGGAAAPGQDAQQAPADEQRGAA